MKTIRFVNTGLEVTPLCSGTVNCESSRSKDDGKHQRTMYLKRAVILAIQSMITWTGTLG